jgi:mRNA-degrading endonuclease YafQ of YafQ-DinJ toxin-antitoxin module
MIADALMSDAFEQTFSRLPFPMRDIVKRKIRLLSENPGHPSLNTHRLHNVKANIWDCYISESMRLLYEIKDNNLQDTKRESPAGCVRGIKRFLHDPPCPSCCP